MPKKPRARDKIATTIDEAAALLAPTEPAASNDNHTKTDDEIAAWLEAGGDFVVRLREFVQRAMTKKTTARAVRRVFEEVDGARYELGVKALEKAVRIVVVEEGGDDRLMNFAVGLVLRNPDFVRIP